MTTAHYGLNNVCLIIDRNEYQSQGNVDAMMRIEPLEEKWRAFGWRCVRIDGHAIPQVWDALGQAQADDKKPLAIIAQTVKGKGISFLEHSHKGHNYALSEDEYSRARRELRENLGRLEAQP